ncbi:tyrosine-type recombinase/integrase [Planktotalea sp.]|uniref:tyrosine-type recombinase/integrase n=1 Tax=Planktotalea sp. TaxID=2029877 RepID=UPI0035C7B2AB
MSSSLEQACLRKNGGKQYYLQFHIKPWMKRLPWFRRYIAQYPNRKNVKESLRTPSLYTALGLLHKRLPEMGLVWSEASNSLEPLPAKEITTLTEEGEYFQAIEQLSLLGDSQLIPTMDSAHPDAPSLPRDIEEEVFVESMEFGDNRPDQRSKAEVQARHNARMKAYDRAESKEDQKRFPDPHPYEATLLSAAALLVSEYEADHRAKKDTAKISTATKKFLAWLEQDDVPLNKVTPNHVKQYVRYARDANIPKNTFSAEIGKLKQIYAIAMEEGRLATDNISPFSIVSLRGFKPAKVKASYSPQQAEILAQEAAANRRKDILINVGVSYYTGMRSSELYECHLKDVDGILCFEVKDGKTVSSKGNVPLHHHLLEWLQQSGSLPQMGSGFNWASPTESEFNKAFNRFSDTYLLKKHGISEDAGTLSHHSFRHGMSTRLFEAGYSELEVAHVVGRSSETVGRTEAAKTYIKKASLSVLRERINSIEAISLPSIRDAI